ncbi:glutamate dehydrogenase : Glutamate dehydrogenase OS=Pedosphaera parvula (strain Ellin514) GN=Cflav_PD2095 PE=3 SV=1: ELFV_dehydrog_N: ELFV_dehydrog [Gemmata massiliana]|uniref:Glutamate dehydrogenase n=1 Tax=Gemmata massiliana TaxID=1210884 RepID=A0A6P2D5M9_9BACT|nr:Glu/Leu/Phe/Val dehydrogenase [Gemmata massiliana]VTR95404.1 glutamate dehydrogenase : Glutamate dehydrogenase OS=Pedosphaera parvula (strain Ellin514) GN=Cflav_PD2095 PE=3 SV=1: ELFV_dehydrog_N: ELFV_dehydrog [Gemmata massiliana]
MSAMPPGNPASNPFVSSPTYLMACQQLRNVARVIDLDKGVAERLMVPKRSQIVAVPVRMEDGHTEVFVGYRVQHSLTSGPSKGGLRYAKNVDLGEVAALAMWMSWKCGIMNLPYGGAKGGIAVDPAELKGGEKERLTRRFTDEIQNIIGPRVDVMAPDMGTDEQTMAWIYDTYSMKVGYACPEIVTGKPVELGGCVGRKEATGRGVVYCISEAFDELNIKSEGATAVVQGFGNVGSVTCDELVKLGTKVIAIGDRYGSIRNDRGINIARLNEYVSKNERKTIVGFPEAEAIADAELLTTPCTVLVPAAMERVITAENAGKLKCRVLAEGANGPTDPEADAILANTDIFVVPDILCNAGGVTVSYFEWVQDLAQFMWDEEEVNAQLKKLMLGAFKRVRDEAKTRKIGNRLAALSLGVQKVAREKSKRGLYP